MAIESQTIAALLIGGDEKNVRLLVHGVSIYHFALRGVAFWDGEEFSSTQKRRDFAESAEYSRCPGIGHS
jgi:hypothetical protein